MNNRYLRARPLKALDGETIKQTVDGSDLTTSSAQNGARTIHTESGREYVLWTSMGVQYLCQVITRGDTK